MFLVLQTIEKLTQIDSINWCIMVAFAIMRLHFQFEQSIDINCLVNIWKLSEVFSISRILIPTKMIKVVLGKGGSTIHEIQESTNTK